jgi:hypothetical protein
MRSSNIETNYQALAGSEDEDMSSISPRRKRLVMGNHLLRLMVIILFTCAGFFTWTSHSQL